MAIPDETSVVSVSVVSIDASQNGGRLMATATVDISIDGIEFRVFGLRLMKKLDEKVVVELPTIRDALGRLRPCIEFPAEIQAAIELVITREIVETVRERSAVN